MLVNFLCVAIGGGTGAMARFAVSLALSRLAVAGIPLAVISVNIVGSFLMGLAATYLAKRGMGYVSPLVMTGFLGGFTTFSTFSLEAVTLYETGHPAQAAIYVLGSGIGSIIALMAGISLARMISP